MRECEEESKPELTGFLMQLFGYEAKLSREEYDTKMAEDQSITYIFSARRIRERIVLPFMDDKFLDAFDDGW